MSIPDELPDTISTPEGDGEDAPGVPLAPYDEDLITPPGSAPSPYDSDKSTDKTKPRGLEKFIDEVADGEFM
jgi:hypothetical protein